VFENGNYLHATTWGRAASACLFFAAALVSGISCSAYRELRISAEETILEGDGGTLDLQWTDDYAFVDATVNGVGPLRFLLDTGAGVLVIAPAAAAKLDLDPVPLYPESAGIDLAAARSTAVRVREVAPIQELRAGPLLLRDVDASIVDLELLAGAIGRPFDGILPVTAFREVLLTIDYPGRTVTVRRGELPVPGEGSEGAHVVPLNMETLPHVMISPGDKADVEPLSMLLDTGSSGFLSIPSASTLRFRSSPVATGRHVTLGVVVPRRQGRIDGTLMWAGHALEDPVVALAPDHRGYAGAALLRHFRVTLDMAHKRVRFEHDSAEPIRCPPVRGIGAEAIRQPGRWIIDYVLDGSPAALAGLAVGDRVETVAGIPVAEMPGVVFDVLLATGPSVRMRVSGPSGTRELDIPVVTFVE
jgi:predicted aspartyl protease